MKTSECLFSSFILPLPHHGESANAQSRHDGDIDDKVDGENGVARKHACRPSGWLQRDCSSRKETAKRGKRLAVPWKKMSRSSNAARSRRGLILSSNHAAAVFGDSLRTSTRQFASTMVG